MIAVCSPASWLGIKELCYLLEMHKCLTIRRQYIVALNILWADLLPLLIKPDKVLRCTYQMTKVSIEPLHFDLF